MVRVAFPTNMRAMGYSIDLVLRHRPPFKMSPRDASQVPVAALVPGEVTLWRRSMLCFASHPVDIGDTAISGGDLAIPSAVSRVWPEKAFVSLKGQHNLRQEPGGLSVRSSTG